MTRATGRTVGGMRAPALAVVALLAAGPSAAAEPRPRLAPPVRGEVVRGFAYGGDPFSRGHHRGADLAAAPGDRVRAACSGRVAFAGSAGASGRAVTVRCGAWSVTHLPLRDIAVRAGDRVVAGAPIAAVATALPGHAGLHLGVRRASDRLGYVDPAPLLREPPPHVPPIGPSTTPRRIASPPPHPVPSSPDPRPAPLPSAVPARAAPRAGSSPAGSAAPAARPALAPWPAWAGLALLLAGAAGAGTARVRRARRVAPARAKAAPVR